MPVLAQGVLHSTFCDGVLGCDAEAAWQPRCWPGALPQCCHKHLQTSDLCLQSHRASFVALLCCAVLRRDFTAARAAGGRGTGLGLLHCKTSCS